MAVAGLKALQQYILREVLKDAPKGVIQTLPNKDLIEINVQILAQRLMQAGIDPTKLKNANQVENAIISIENRPKVQQGIKNTESAKVFDLEGKEIDPKKGIMGGKQIPDDDLPPPGSRGGPDDIAAPVQSEDEILEKLEKENREARRNLQIKLSKDKGYQKFKGETEEEIRKRFGLDDPEDMAQGGRAGFKGGSYDYNSFEHKINELKAAYKRYKKGSSTGGRGGIMTFEQFAPLFAAENFATGGRAGFDNGGLLSMLNIQGEGSKTGKQQIEGAPEGITMDNETYNFIVNADIPIGEKINLLTKYGRGKGRTRIEKDDQELFLDEGGSRTREIGLDFNPDAKKGFSGNIMYNPDSDDVRGGITYKFNEGGRAGFKDGMTRRTFLKILGGAMSIPIVGKILKPLKLATGVKKVPIIKTDNVPGKPEWFDALVNKVIVEGDDVTKKFATGERQSIHQKTLDDGSVVRVTEDVDDGAVRVEYESDANVFEDPVQLQYKKPLPDEGDPRPTAEFTTAESGPVGRRYGPDDYEIDIDEVGGTSIRDLDSDVSKLKEYATGKGPTMKEIVQNKKRRDKAKAISEDPEAQSDAVIRRQGEAQDYDYEDFASGGIARMLGE